MALAALHRLLLAQGRDGRSAPYGELLAARREQDPYYWLGLGLDQLQQGRPAQAVEPLERAQALTTGFEEVHRCWPSPTGVPANRCLPATSWPCSARSIGTGRAWPHWDGS